MKPIIIAIDGHSSCGKSTLARDLARSLGYRYADTGAMYRAATLYCLEHGLLVNGKPDPGRLEAELPNINIEVHYDAAEARQEIFLNGVNVEGRIREMDVSRHVSAVSAVPALRLKLIALQRSLGRDNGLVVDGRDIGSVVFPGADLKIFMTASLAERARRRHRELTASGKDISLDEVSRNLAGRDEMDAGRKLNPLVIAPGAKVLDNTELNREQQKEIALGWLKDLGFRI